MERRSRNRANQAAGVLAYALVLTCVAGVFIPSLSSLIA